MKKISIMLNFISTLNCSHVGKKNRRFTYHVASSPCDHNTAPSWQGMVGSPSCFQPASDAGKDSDRSGNISQMLSASEKQPFCFVLVGWCWLQRIPCKCLVYCLWLLTYCMPSETRVNQFVQGPFMHIFVYFIQEYCCCWVCITIMASLREKSCRTQVTGLIWPMEIRFILFFKFAFA